MLKQDGEIIVVLVRQERLKKFSEVWRLANLDYYTTQTQQDRQLKKQKAGIVGGSNSLTQEDTQLTAGE